jgi:hypothetical protein
MNLQSTVTAKNAINPQLKEVISIRFDQKTESKVRSEIFSWCVVIIVRSYEVLYSQ